MVISRSSPPSTSFSGDCASCSTSAGDRYCAERRANLPALRLLAHEAGEDQRQVDRRGRHQRIGEIDQQAVLGVEVPGRSDQRAREHRAERHQRDRSERGRERDHQQAEQQRGDELDGDAVDRLRDHRAGQRALQHLGMDLDAGHGARNRRGLDVVEPDRRGADQHQLAGDLVGRDTSFPARRSREHRSRGRCGRSAPRAGRCCRSESAGP